MIRRRLLLRTICALLVFTGACGGAAGTAPPDVALQPRGHGWFCHRSPNRDSECVREERDCISRSDQHAGDACSYAKSATCVTMVRKQSGGGARCFERADECEV